MLYRKHGENVKGAERYSPGYFISRLAGFSAVADLVRKTARQGTAFYSIYGERLSGEDRNTVYGFSTLLEKKRRSRVYTILKHGYRGPGLFRNLGIFFLWILLKDGKGP